MIASVLKFLHDYGPWLTASVIPSLIVGLSKSPKTRKATDWLKYLLQFISILTPSDAPGTMKAPFIAKSKLPPKAPKAPPVPPSVASLLILISFLGMSVIGSGCAWLSSTGGRNKDAVINCGVETVMGNAANLIATVRTIVTGGAVNWQEQLDALKGMGEEALACAMHSVGDDLQRNALPPTDALGDSPDKQKMRAVSSQGSKKALSYMQKQGWKTSASETK